MWSLVSLVILVGPFNYLGIGYGGMERNPIRLVSLAAPLYSVLRDMSGYDVVKVVAFHFLTLFSEVHLTILTSA